MSRTSGSSWRVHRPGQAPGAHRQKAEIGPKRKKHSIEPNREICKLFLYNDLSHDEERIAQKRTQYGDRCRADLLESLDQPTCTHRQRTQVWTSGANVVNLRKQTQLVGSKA
jgi:hypothetical protein